jgi:hypothetical protein
MNTSEKHTWGCNSIEMGARKGRNCLTFCITLNAKQGGVYVRFRLDDKKSFLYRT